LSVPRTFFGVRRNNPWYQRYRRTKLEIRRMSYEYRVKLNICPYVSPIVSRVPICTIFLQYLPPLSLCTLPLPSLRANCVSSCRRKKNKYNAAIHIYLRRKPLCLFPNQHYLLTSPRPCTFFVDSFTGRVSSRESFLHTLDYLLPLVQRGKRERERIE